VWAYFDDIIKKGHPISWMASLSAKAKNGTLPTTLPTVIVIDYHHSRTAYSQISTSLTHLKNSFHPHHNNQHLNPNERSTSYSI
jgi:hypothetical protein